MKTFDGGECHMCKTRGQANCLLIGAQPTFLVV